VFFMSLFKFSSSNPYLSDPNVQLMLDFQNGNKAAFETLMGQYYRRILNFIYRYLGNKERAEDLTQEVFIKVYHEQNHYRPTAQFRTWLYTIAKNLSFNELKRHHHKSVSLDQFQTLDVEDQTAHPDKILADEEMANVVKKVISELPENQRMALILRRYDNFSYEEIAETMGLSSQAVKSLLNRAKDNLRLKLGKFIKE